MTRPRRRPLWRRLELVMDAWREQHGGGVRFDLVADDSLVRTLDDVREFRVRRRHRRARRITAADRCPSRRPSLRHRADGGGGIRPTLFRRSRLQFGEAPAGQGGGADIRMAAPPGTRTATALPEHERCGDELPGHLRRPEGGRSVAGGRQRRRLRGRGERAPRRRHRGRGGTADRGRSDLGHIGRLGGLPTGSSPSRKTERHGSLPVCSRGGR